MTLRDKIEKEKAKLEEAGSFEEYVKQRQVKVNLLGFIIAVAVGFVLGAIIF